MSTNRAEQIDAIISKRQTRADKIKLVKPRWESLKSALEELESYRQQLSGDSELVSQLTEIDFSTVIGEINRELGVLENLAIRLSRNTLNIGVVGRMRQGKSRLLQSLTGLDQEAIPTSDQGVCTRGLSKIFHANNPKEVKYQIEFHSWFSFIDIIHLYYEKLGLSDPPFTPQDFSNGKRPPGLPEDKRDENSRFMYGRLRKEYYGNFEKYKSLLNGSTLDISKEQIKQYITQDGSQNSEYLAVKELRIVCEFPYHQEVGKIGVVDLPGLGDDSIFDVERLIKALKQDIDFILFVRRPDPMGDDWQEADRTMFKTAREALGDFPITDCSFMVLNRVNEAGKDSFNACQRFGNTISQHEIKVERCVIANCADSEDVRLKVLRQVIDYLADNIDSVYEQYLRSHDKLLVELQSEISDRLEAATRSLAQYGQEGDLAFDDWFDKQLWPNLNSGLQTLLRELRKNRSTNNVDFESEVKNAVKNCRLDTVIPSIDDIEERHDEYDDSYKLAYYMSIKEIREKLSNNFKSPLGNAIGRLLKEVQASVIDVLVDRGNLGALTGERGPNFFQDLIEKMPIDVDSIRQGFEDIERVRDTYDDIIMNWIKEHIDELSADKIFDPISEKKLPDFLLNISINIGDNSDTIDSQLEMEIPVGKLLETASNLISKRVSNSSEAELILNSLNSLRSTVVDECETTLNNKLNEPNELAFTMVRDFVDRIFAAKGVQTEWRKFLRKERAKVWPGAKRQQEYAQVQQRWETLVNNAKAANQPKLLRLL